jgi:preprotein translocase subunit SecE
VAKSASRKPKARSKSKRRRENAIVRYLRETIAELKRVSWPNRQEATRLTLIVLATTVAMSAFLGIVDLLSTQHFSVLIGPSG